MRRTTATCGLRWCKSRSLGARARTREGGVRMNRPASNPSVARVMMKTPTRVTRRTARTNQTWVRRSHRPQRETRTSTPCWNTAFGLLVCMCQKLCSASHARKVGAAEQTHTPQVQRARRRSLSAGQRRSGVCSVGPRRWPRRRSRRRRWPGRGRPRAQRRRRSRRATRATTAAETRSNATSGGDQQG